MAKEAPFKPKDTVCSPRQCSWLLLACMSGKGICFLRLSDNEELINQYTAHQSYKYPYPNATTKGEFDVVEEITRSSDKYSISRNFKWVKGHQDDDKKAELSIEALLNIEADALAGSYQERNEQDNLRNEAQVK